MENVYNGNMYMIENWNQNKDKKRLNNLKT